MGDNELVSVIVPVYNVRPYLNEALDSVIRQTYENLEIIVIDDGSTDGSGEICNEYARKDPRICVIHQENKGLSAARNAGLERITGTIVAMLDPDDAYDIFFIEKLLSAMNREQADLAMGKFTVHYTAGKFHRRGKDIQEPRMEAGTYDRKSVFLALSDGRANVSVWNKLYRSELWEKVRFLDGHVCEDNEAAYQIANESRKMVVIDSPVYYHRKRSGSITENLTRQFLSDQVLAVTRVEQFAAENLADILPEKNMLEIQQLRINVMMNAYARLFRIKESFDKKTEGEKMRQQILGVCEKINLRNCRLRTRVAYQMICFCPWLFRMGYPIYRPIRFIEHKLTWK